MASRIAAGNDLGALDISTLQRERRPKKAPAKRLDPSLHWLKDWSVSLKAPADTAAAPGAPRAPGDASEALAELESLRQVQPPTTLIDAADAIPTDSPDTFLAYLQRDINCLGEESVAVRIQSLRKLERVLVQQMDGLPTDIVDAVADALLKPLLKRMKDKSEKCRELSVKILRSLVDNTSDISAMLPYTFPTLVARLGCEDLDGVAHLPEVARPNPEQKPVEIARPVEESEEVRLELAHFVAALLARCTQTHIYSYIDEAAGLIRAQAMDPFHEVKVVACQTMISFCHNHTEMLLHFAEPLARSLTSCLTHNHAKLRIAALRALTAVLWCGVWKHNFEVMQMLMAWQDPNKVPIKAFYEPVTSVNYMSTLSFDRHPAVRRFWFETLAYWLLKVPDKVDHEPYIFPYLLTGLCDDNDEIALETFWLIERCGELYEQDHADDLKKTKQYGFDYGWTYQGRAFVPFPLQGLWAGGDKAGHVRRTAAHGPDFRGEKALQEHRIRDKLEEDEEERQLGPRVPLPDRDYAWWELRDLAVYRNLPRPRLGSRCYVRTHTRRYIKATFNDVVDFRDCTALNAGRLLCMSLAYTEEGITEWLQPMFAALRKFYSGRSWASGDSKVMRTFDTVCKLLGAFLDPVSYWGQLKDAFDHDTALDLGQRVASVRLLALCVEGSVLTLLTVQPHDPTLGMGRLTDVIPALISAVHASDLLLAPSPESRDALWSLLFSFLAPLRPHLDSSQVSQLLYVSFALAAKPAPEASGELLGGGFSSTGVLPQLEEEEQLVDADKLEQVLTILGQGIATETPSPATFSLDSLDDDDNFACPAEPQHTPVVAPSADPRVIHLPLFERAFSEVLARLEDSFQVFRSVVYLSPLPMLTRPTHCDAILGRLAVFCGTGSAAPTRCAGQELGLHLALRCARLVDRAPGSAEAAAATTLISKVFQLLARAQLAGSEDVRYLSYVVILSGLAVWRRFLLCPYANPRSALFSQEVAEPSVPLQWFAAVMADQELYKRFHLVLERAECTQSGRDKEGFVVAKARQLREEADRRANVVRAAAASTLLLALRCAFHSNPSPWPASQQSSMSAIFVAAASLFRTAAPTMDPPLVKPTPAFMVLYAAELLHLLLQAAAASPTTAKPAELADRVDGVDAAPQDVQALPDAFRLLDDAARAIQQLPVPRSTPRLPLELEPADQDKLVAEFVTALLELNLTLPPDPQARHAPAALDDAAADIVLGWDEAPTVSLDANTVTSAAVRTQGMVPREVHRLLAQSSECLRWNAALALYILGVDLSVVCQDSFQNNLAKWRRRQEQAKVLITADLLERARRTLQQV